MPSKKRKYNARFPAGRIKKIMQTDEEVGKVAQAVPIIISRTLELFVESLLSKAMQVTVARNAKTLSPSHVKQCILAESRFDFLRDLVQNIPDVSVAEEKEMMSAENSPTSSRYSEMSVLPRRIGREDSNSSSSSDVKIQPGPQIKEIRRGVSVEAEPKYKTETIASTVVSTDTVIDLSVQRTEVKCTEETLKPIRTANFYQETLLDDIQSPKSVIHINPSYTSPQPSTSSYSKKPTEPSRDISVPKSELRKFLEIRQNNNTSITQPRTPVTPVTPILNIDFSKNLTMPEIKVLDTSVANMVGVKNDKTKNNQKLFRQNSKPPKTEIKRVEIKPLYQQPTINLDHLNSGNLQIDEDYDT